MNTSQSDHLELWKSFTNGNMEGNLQILSKLKFGAIGEDFVRKLTSDQHVHASSSEADFSGPSRTGKIFTLGGAQDLRTRWSEQCT